MRVTALRGTDDLSYTRSLSEGGVPGLSGAPVISASGSVWRESWAGRDAAAAARSPPSVDTNTGCSSSLNPPFKTNDPHAGAISEYIGESNVWCAADTDDTGVSESAGVTLTRLCSALTSVLHLRYGPSREGAPVRRRGRIWGRGGGPQNPGSYSHTSMLVSISICCIFFCFFFLNRSGLIV